MILVLSGTAQVLLCEGTLPAPSPNADKKESSDDGRHDYARHFPGGRFSAAPPVRWYRFGLMVMTVRASGSTPGCQRVICVTAGELPLGASLQLPLKNGRDRWTKHNGNSGCHAD